MRFAIHDDCRSLAASVVHHVWFVAFATGPTNVFSLVASAAQ
ncbi:MAG TPA: hypothetical protein VM681_01355 [Candidatus Thermoplasmatota archaeon]|nr:hypothetical protein [Candidatus Thermoplasmatota archaeon]